MAMIGARTRLFGPCAIAAAALVAVQPAGARSADHIYNFDIEAQDLGAALRAFAGTARQQVTFDKRTISAKRAPALRGTYSAEEALRRLTRGSGLTVEIGRSGLFIIRAAPQRVSPLAQDGGLARPISFAQNAAVPQAPNAASRPVTQTDAAPALVEPMADRDSSDIIVTAQKREQRLIDVPVSITVASAQMLERANVTGLKGLPQLSPSVNFFEGAGDRASGIDMRGISSVASEGGIQPSVSLVVDGVSIARQADFTPDFADVARIEVLNGPQGTLFGKNSTAGAINVVMNRPTDQLGGYLQAGITTDEEYSVNGVLNAPLGEGLKLRINGFYRNLAPLVKNLGPGGGAYGYESYGIMGKLAIDISDKADFLLTADYRNRKSSFGPNLIIEPKAGAAGVQQLAVLGGAVGRGVDLINTNTPGRSVSDGWGVTGELNVDLSDQLKLVSITGYRYSFGDFEADVDSTGLGFQLGQGFTPGSFNYPALFLGQGRGRSPDTMRYWSQETRLQYSDERLDAVAGLYYQHFSEVTRVSVPLLMISGTGAQTYVNDDVNARITNSVIAGFADATIKLSQPLSIFGGLRYTHEKIRNQLNKRNWTSVPRFDPVTGADRLNVATLEFTGPFVPFSFDAKDALNNLSGRVGIQFQPSPDQNFYASYSRGYKGPAANITRAATTAATALLRPETARAYEVGAKFRFLDGRANFSIAAYDQIVHDVQQSATDTTQTSGNPSTILLNAGNIKTRGVEATGDIRLADGLRFNAGVAYTHARYDKTVFTCNPLQTRGVGPCSDGSARYPGLLAGAQDLTGTPARDTPLWKVVAGLDYDRDISAKLALFSHIGYVWTDDIQFQLGRDPATIEPSHGQLDMSIGLRSTDDRWQIMLFGKNLTNEYYYTSLTSNGLIGRIFGRRARDSERYFGATLKVTY